MSDPVRVGVIGTSAFAEMVHLSNLKSHPQAEIAAICGRNPDRAREMAKKYEIPLVFTDYREMIEKGDLHAIEVIAPDDLHYPMTMDALDAGLHVLCEKPLALNAEQAKAMYDKAEVAGVVHMTFFTYRWLPFHRYLKQLVQDGHIGRCIHCYMRYVGGYGRGPQYRWRWDRQRANGAVGDLGSHMIDFARWYVGDIGAVSAQLDGFVARPGLDGKPVDPSNDAAMLLLRFQNGAQGLIHLSAVAHVGDRVLDQHITLYGESGTFELDFTFAGTRLACVREGEKQFGTLDIPIELWANGDPSDLRQAFEVFRHQSAGDRLFVDAILEDRPVTPSFYEGFKVQQVIDAAIASDQSGTWVSLE